MDAKYLIWFTIWLIGGFYIRHWVHTGSGQFKRLGELLGGDW